MMEFNGIVDRILRLLNGFPSILNQKIPRELFSKLKKMPPMEDFYDPNIPRIQWITPWTKAVDEALEYNEKYLTNHPTPEP